ncbi:MAG: hypothetical protein QXQ91_00780 [Nanopusillaceae archaeon]
MVSLSELRQEKIGEKHKLFEAKIVIDNPRYRLEQIYFWLLDFLRDNLKLNVLKISDEFGSSIASAFFTDIVRREITILDNATKLGGLINTIIKSIISIDNEYRTIIAERIARYDELKSDNPEISFVALKALKSIWLDNVDSKKGATSLMNLRGRLGYSTIVDLFIAVEYEEKLRELIKKEIVNKSVLSHNNFIDISYYEKNNIVNERVISILKSRLTEFYNWLEQSEKYIRERERMLKAYLIHQINSLVYYTEIAKPYLKAAKMLIQKNYDNPDLVKSLESVMIEIDLLASDAEKEISEWDFNKKELVTKKYIPVYEINILSRSRPTLQAISPERSPIYTYFGRIDIIYRAYLLEKSEYDELIASKEIEDLLYIEGLTEEFLKQIASAICNYYIFDKIISNKDLLEETKKYFKKTDIKKPEDITWTREFIENLERVDKNITRGLEWIKKYLPLEKNKEVKKSNKETKESTASMLFSAYKDFLDIFYKLFEFIVSFGKDLSTLKYSNVKKKIEIEKENLKMSIKDKGWTIYSTFKKTFGLLNY